MTVKDSHIICILALYVIRNVKFTVLYSCLVVDKIQTQKLEHVLKKIKINKSW